MQLKRKMLFGTNCPRVAPERCLKDCESAGFHRELKPLILTDDAIRALGLAKAA
jgi:predicted TIM-barrel fold metal-dependent hydrolase